MKIQFEGEDFEKVYAQIEKETIKAINKVAQRTIFDFETNPKLRKYLIILIKDCIREELKFKDGLLVGEKKDG